MTSWALTVHSKQVTEPTLMTSDLLGAEVATGCLPYWRHELAPVPPRLTLQHATDLARLAWSLAPHDRKPLVVLYLAAEGAPQTGRVILERTLRRGRWLRRMRRVVVVECMSVEQLARLLADRWSASGNDTLIVVLGAQAGAQDYLETRFVDDVEANPTNEEGLMLDCIASLSKGWDGLDARIFSRQIGPAAVRDALAAL